MPDRGVHLLIREGKGWRTWCGLQGNYQPPVNSLVVLANWLHIQGKCPECWRAFQEYEKKSRLKGA